METPSRWLENKNYKEVIVLLIVAYDIGRKKNFLLSNAVEIRIMPSLCKERPGFVRFTVPRSAFYTFCVTANFLKWSFQSERPVNCAPNLALIDRFNWIFSWAFGFLFPFSLGTKIWNLERHQWEQRVCVFRLTSPWRSPLTRSACTRNAARQPSFSRCLAEVIESIPAGPDWVSSTILWNQIQSLFRCLCLSRRERE